MIKPLKINYEEVCELVHCGDVNGPLEISFNSVWDSLDVRSTKRLIAWLEEAVVEMQNDNKKKRRNPTTKERGE